MNPDARANLVELMAEHNLTRADVARMLGLKPRHGGSHGTVDMWLSGANRIPVSKLELIALKAPTWKKQND
jgi:transcriptional regulator with XRE-family HTH domain